MMSMHNVPDQQSVQSVFSFLFDFFDFCEKLSITVENGHFFFRSHLFSVLCIIINCY